PAAPRAPSASTRPPRAHRRRHLRREVVAPAWGRLLTCLRSRSTVLGATTVTTVPLAEIAHGHSGDEGGHANLAAIADRTGRAAVVPDGARAKHPPPP